MPTSLHRRCALVVFLATIVVRLPASAVIGQHDNPGASPDEIPVAEAANQAVSVPGYSFLPIPALGFPLRVTPDGTAILVTHNGGDVYAYRWHRGVVTALSCTRPPGTRIRLHAANRNGMVVVVFELPTRAFFVFEGGVTKQVVVAWMPDSATPVFLNVPIARATTWYNQSVMRSVDFKQLDDQNRIWGDTYHEVNTGDGNVTYPELARWDTPDAAATFIGHRQHLTPSVALLGVSSVHGEPFGHYFPPEPGLGGYPFAGSFANRLNYIPSRMNSQGWVLGKSGFTPKLSRNGVEYPIPAIPSINQIDDRNNLTDGSRVNVWTTNSQTFDSVPTAGQNSYVLATTTAITLPEGFGTDVRVIPGTDIELGTLFAPNSSSPALFVAADIRPDANRDGTITTGRAAGDPDRKLADLKLPWFFWINDDNDAGETDGSDIPGRGANGQDSTVNGVRDLVDYFPLRLNIARLLKVLPLDTPGVNYRLVQTDGAANFITTDLNPEAAGAYHRDPVVARAIASRPVTPITPQGTPLESAFLGNLTDDNGGVILVEARSATRKPLQLEAWRGTDMVARVDLPLSLAPVETMFRHRNLVKACNMQPLADAADRADAPNWPSVLNNDQAFLFVHGYNVNQRQARGWHAEFFKRLWWTGSKAQFWGVTWYGYESQRHVRNLRFTPNYHVNVVHAFGSAPDLASLVTGLKESGFNKINVAGHSLGNMVVSSAISDHAAPVDRYFMIDAAVAAEAYDGGENSVVLEGEGSTAMPHTEWDKDLGGVYPKILWAANWHSLFPATDERAKLTWRDRFAPRQGTEYFDFYSSGEEVLDHTEANTPAVLGLLWLIGITKLSEFLHIDLPGNTGQPAGHRSWQLQEQLKGRNITDRFGGSNYGGWGFNTFEFKNTLGNGKGPTLSPALLRPGDITSDMLNMVFTPEVLREEPFFRPGRHRKRIGSWVYNATTGRNSWQEDQLGLIYSPTSGSAFAKDHRNTLLARMIPALSPAAGRIGIPRLTPQGSQIEHNYDMNGAVIRPLMDSNGNPLWPAGGGRDFRWWHSDLREVAYPYVNRLYGQITFCGKLRDALP